MNKINGNLKGDLALEGFWTHLDDVNRWTVNGRVLSDRIEFQGNVLGDSEALLKLEDGAVHLIRLQTMWKDSLILGDASLDLQSPHRFETELTASDIELETTLAQFKQLSNHEGLRGNGYHRSQIAWLT